MPCSSRSAWWHIPDAKLPLQLLPFAIASFIGPSVAGTAVRPRETRYVMRGSLLGAALMLAGALTEAWIGVETAGQSLEAVSKPLQSR